MDVICKNGTIKLVKNLTYQVVALENSKPGKIGRAYIKDIGWYSVNNFKTLDNKDLPKIDIVRKVYVDKMLEFSDILKGDILICKTTNYKSLIKNGLYKIQEISSVTKQVMTWNGTTRNQTDNYIKFEGVSRKLMFSPWNFKKLPVDQAREMVLEQVLNDAPDKVTRKDFKNLRKIEHIDNKDKELIAILAKSILDSNRHQLTVVDWATQQLGKRLDLIADDYKELLNMKLQDILTLID